ncbi:uncharacterized protein PHALS_15206 [Plasmopara halstedii]|uniref:Uncharacterized protein n=1 Tax=Plasmopara halstedii TaxID=4781 RepID=A0A0P1B549_PLAHL|nr:uncharacterized protein PHALS_15206 [Plasmopara halstedii]CEG49278.1 hypothetical protein PHALS_15206 [Plasmopara halstedii]|eukprot:XP_024585647.1 hypothetical protein PHALS_15206 [Plasmopara halstedii]
MERYHESIAHDWKPFWGALQHHSWILQILRCESDPVLTEILDICNDATTSEMAKQSQKNYLKFLNYLLLLFFLKCLVLD